jgi:1-deoxy-D-xylulose-5-phosphate synthase
MLIHDISIQKLHVVLAVDRAGIVGEDGETHQGIYDVGFLSTIPGMVILAPSSLRELDGMLRFAVSGLERPAAVRYPRGTEGNYKAAWSEQRADVIRLGSDVTIVTHGIILNDVLDAASFLAENGISAEVIKLNLINPIDYDAVLESVGKTGKLFVVEEMRFRRLGGRAHSRAFLRARFFAEAYGADKSGRKIYPPWRTSLSARRCGLDARSIAGRVERCFNV